MQVSITSYNTGFIIDAFLESAKIASCKTCEVKQPVNIKQALYRVYKLYPMLNSLLDEDFRSSSKLIKFNFKTYYSNKIGWILFTPIRNLVAIVWDKFIWLGQLAWKNRVASARYLNAIVIEEENMSLFLRQLIEDLQRDKSKRLRGSLYYYEKITADENSFTEAAECLARDNNISLDKSIEYLTEYMQDLLDFPWEASSHNITSKFQKAFPNLKK